MPKKRIIYNLKTNQNVMIILFCESCIDEKEEEEEEEEEGEKYATLIITWLLAINRLYCM